MEEVKKRGNKTPVILLTGQGDRNIDLTAMKSGAYDYLTKSEVTASLLERSIRYALERRKMEDLIYQEKEWAEVTLESIGDSVITTDTNGTILHLNRVAQKLTGWSSQEAYGVHFEKVVNLIEESTRQSLAPIIERVVIQNQIINLPLHSIIISRDGTEYAVEGTVSPIRDQKHHIVGIVMTLHDVTENRELAKKLSYQASHDPLTDLFNRLQFDEDLRALIEDAKKTGHKHVLLYMDLDKFKHINDTCGHSAGDQCLKEIAGILQQTVRQSDCIARLGGDEFGIIIKNCTPDIAHDIAQKISESIRNYRFTWGNHEFTCGISIGMALIDASCKDCNSVLNTADQACYRKKSQGGNQVKILSQLTVGS